jgi:Helix-turn-helix domain
MNISEILKSNPELAGNIQISTNARDLQELAEYCIERGRKEKIKPEDPEEYLTPAEYAKTLKISLVTLWSWDKKGLTKPLRIGNQKRYRRSDLEKILLEG